MEKMESIEQEASKILINARFKITKLIRKSKRDITYRAVDKQTKALVIVILHFHEQQQNKTSRFLLQECKSIVEVLWQGQVQIKKKNYYVRVIKNYGPSIKEFCKVIKKIDVETLYLLANSILTLLEDIHNRDLIHLELKPSQIVTHQNFSQNNKLFVLNYNHCNRLTKVDIQNLSVNKFSSLNMHLKMRPTYKDDLQSMVYILYWCLNNTLFKFQSASKTHKLKFIEESKIKFRFTQDINYPGIDILNQFYNTIKFLQYGQKINYGIWKKKFYSSARSAGKMPKYIWQRMLDCKKSESDQELQQLNDLSNKINSLPKQNYFD